jgi:hypothetical protein
MINECSIDDLFCTINVKRKLVSQSKASMVKQPDLRSKAFTKPAVLYSLGNRPKGDTLRRAEPHWVTYGHPPSK